MDHPHQRRQQQRGRQARRDPYIACGGDADVVIHEMAGPDVPVRLIEEPQLNLVHIALHPAATQANRGSFACDPEHVVQPFTMADSQFLLALLVQQPRYAP